MHHCQRITIQGGNILKHKQSHMRVAIIPLERVLAPLVKILNFPIFSHTEKCLPPMTQKDGCTLNSKMQNSNLNRIKKNCTLAKHKAHCHSLRSSNKLTASQFKKLHIFCAKTIIYHYIFLNEISQWIGEFLRLSAGRCQLIFQKRPSFFTSQTK